MSHTIHACADQQTLINREGQRSRKDPPLSPRKQRNKVLIPTDDQLAALQGQGSTSIASTSYAPPLPSGSCGNPFTAHAPYDSGPYVDPNSSQGIYAGFQMYNSDLADSAVGDTTEPEAYSFNYDYDYDI